MAEKIPAYKGNGNFAFISYSHKDRKHVYPIISSLINSGYNIWYDEGIPLAADYGEELYRRIKACSVFVLFVSKNAIASDDVNKEVQNAFALRKQIIRIHIDKPVLPDSWAYHLPATSQFICISEDSELVLSKLRQALYYCRDNIPAQEAAEQSSVNKTAAPSSADDVREVSPFLSSYAEDTFATFSVNSSASPAKPKRTWFKILIAAVIASFALFVLFYSIPLFFSALNELLNLSADNVTEPPPISAPAADEYDFSGIRVNDKIRLGHFEQDNILDNGAEEIEWRVLKVQENKALIIAERGLIYKQYNVKDVKTSWEECTLRAWLNNDFYNEVFTDAEKGIIIESALNNEYNSKYSTPAGNNTTDRIFCLSLSEAKHNFPTSNNRMCAPTDYAIATCSGSPHSDIDYWWLRSPGDSTVKAAYVQRRDGDCNHGGLPVASTNVLVRPAMWIETD